MTVVSTVDLRPNPRCRFCYCFLHLESSREKAVTLAMAPWGGQGYFCSPRSCCGGALAMAAPLGEFPSCCSCSIFPQNSPPCLVKMCSDLQEMKLQAHRHALELGLSRSWGGEGALCIPGVGTGNVTPLLELPSAGTPSFPPLPWPQTLPVPPHPKQSLCPEGRQG